MPYRLWHYACKLGGLLFACVFVGMLGAHFHNDVALAVGGVALAIVVILCTIGAFMGLLMVWGKLQMRCPFCGRSGPAWGSKSEGMRMRCPECGLIWSGGKFGLELFRERSPENSAGSGGPAAG
jgi:hypothetical protein